MLLVVILLVAIALALARGGSLEGLADVELKSVWLIFAAFGLQYSLGLTTTGAEWLVPYGPAVHGLSYAALLYFCWLNHGHPGVKTMGTGIGLNALAIFANGGQMPVSSADLVGTGQGDLVAPLAQGDSLTYQLIADDTVLVPLTDVIAVPLHGVLPVEAAGYVISAGDIVLWLGLLLLVQYAMVVSRRTPTESKTEASQAST